MELNCQIRGITFSLCSEEDHVGKEVKGTPGEEIRFVPDFENRKMCFGQLEGKCRGKQRHSKVGG